MRLKGYILFYLNDDSCEAQLSKTYVSYQTPHPSSVSFFLYERRVIGFSNIRSLSDFMVISISSTSAIMEVEFGPASPTHIMEDTMGYITPTIRGNFNSKWAS